MKSDNCANKEIQKVSPYGWRRIHQTEFYLQCLKLGHNPKVHSVSHSLLYLICDKCNKVWRFHFIKLDWLPIPEFDTLKKFYRGE